MCGTPQARASERGPQSVGLRASASERGPRPRSNQYSGPGPRVFDIAPFLGKGGLPMIFFAIYHIIRP